MVLPKHHLTNLAHLMGVKRLSCFSLNGAKNSWWLDSDNPDDNDLLDKVAKLGAKKSSEKIEDYKHAESYLFRKCTVKKWVVYKRSKSAP